MLLLHFSADVSFYREDGVFQQTFPASFMAGNLNRALRISQSTYALLYVLEKLLS